MRLQHQHELIEPVPLLPRGHILIVDDSLNARRGLAALLRAQGFAETSIVASVSEALDYLNAAPNPIDLILMDLVMPEVDGLTGCRQIKAVEEWQEIPIIVVTGADKGEVLRQAFEAGASDYVTKPINTVELSARIGLALRLRHEMAIRRTREQELLEVTQALKKANEELVRLSYLDGLTGLANRRHFEACLEREWRRALRSQTPLSLVLLDIDHFKEFNDTYGHLAGDECLKHVAHIFATLVKRPGDVVARYGGEEFVGVLPETTENGVTCLADQVCAGVEELHIPHSTSKVAAWVTVSIGTATVRPAHEDTAMALIAEADRALYQSKREGRNRVTAGA